MHGLGQEPTDAGARGIATSTELSDDSPRSARSACTPGTPPDSLSLAAVREEPELAIDRRDTVDHVAEGTPLEAETVSSTVVPAATRP